MVFRRFWRYKLRSGRVLVHPGEGLIKIHTHFHPHRVQIRLLGHCHHIPGCGRLHDHVCVESIDRRGFTIRYNVQTGHRKIKWSAWK